MNSAATHTSTNAATSAHELFALSDEQILQIDPDAQDGEMFGGERTDVHDPLREDLDLLAVGAPVDGSGDGRQGRRQGKGADDGLKAVATKATTKATHTQLNARAADASVGTQVGTPAGTSANATSTEHGEAPAWLVARMNDAENGAEARALWDGVQAARQEASAFREVFAKPEDAHAAAARARTLDDFDRAYFGVAGQPSEQLSAARAELAARMLREDPAALREMVFAGLRALEAASQQGIGGASVAPPLSAASSDAITAQNQRSHTQHSAVPTRNYNGETQGAVAAQPNTSQHQATQSYAQQHAQEATRAQDARVTTYAEFERATNAELERGVGGAIDRSLQAALPNAGRSENGAALKERLSSAIRQDVEKALQGDRALGEQVARILSGQRLDHAIRAQVVRLIGDRAQQLVPGSARKVLADWTQTTLATGNRVERGPVQRGSSGSREPIASAAKTRPNERSGSPNNHSPRKIDYRRVSDDDILDF